MSTYLLLHGAASSGWYWHLVQPLLQSAGHQTVAPDLPADDPNAGLADYVTAAVDSLDSRTGDDVILVAQSMAGFIAPIVAETVPVARLVMLAAMIPNPGERGHDWWVNTDQPAAQQKKFNDLGLDPAGMNNPEIVYGHDIPPDLWIEAGRRVRDQTGRPFNDPCPIKRWPSVSTHIVAPRDDRLFPIEFQRRLAKERLGLDIHTIPGGHLPALSHPRAVADSLLQAASE